jgi:hypothetical protein
VSCAGGAVLVANSPPTCRIAPPASVALSTCTQRPPDEPPT